MTTRHLLIVLAVAEIVGLILLIGSPSWGQTITPGMIFATRNVESVGNDSPGFWNHVGVYVGNGWVVEAQRDLHYVVATPLVNVWDRYPEVLVLRVVPEAFGASVAAGAKKQVGLPFVPIRRNCVAVVRRAVKDAGFWHPLWRVPDDVVLASLRNVDHKIDYEGWHQPENWYSGSTRDRWRLEVSP